MNPFPIDWDTDGSPEEILFQKDTILWIAKAMRALQPRIEEIALQYAEIQKESGDDPINYIEGLSEFGPDSYTVTANVGGCNRGCCPSYTRQIDTPTRFLWEPDALEIMRLEKQRTDEVKRERKAAADLADHQRRQAEKEKRDREEYERLQKKFGEQGIKK